MKKLFILCLFVSFYTACSTNITRPLTAGPEPAYSVQADLRAKIEKLPRMTVIGFGQQMKVSSCPIFIVDGIERGNNLFDVCQMLDGEKIKTVDFPRNSGPTIYRNSLLEQPSIVIIKTE